MATRPKNAEKPRRSRRGRESERQLTALQVTKKNAGEVEQMLMHKSPGAQTPSTRKGDKFMPRKNIKRTTKRTPQKRDRAQTTIVDLAAGQRRDEKQADLILAFLNGPINSFLREAVVEALAEAARRIGHPIMAPELKDGKVVVTKNDNPYFQDLRKNLAGLVCLTHGNFTLHISENEKVLQAMSELLRNAQTPQNLFEAVAQFCSEQSNQAPENLYHSFPVLTEILKSVPPEELRGEILKGAA